ncbi:MAG: DUF362 domain-containing protein [Thermodesulfobacteriota bacterium]
MSLDSSRVSVHRCPDYQPLHLTRAVKECLTALEPLPLYPGARVLLKPNCLSADHGPDRPVNTRAEVVEAVGQYLKERHRVRLLIADSGGMGSYGKARRAYALMGLDQAATRLDAELLNLEEIGLIEIKNPGAGLMKNFKATALLERVDAIINLPKMKTHILTGITGAIKNVLGLLPGSLKRAVHVAAPNGPAMAQALVDIYEGIKSKVPTIIHVLDGIMAMEGLGPAGGHPRKVGLLLASKDPVALDAVAAHIMDFPPSRVLTVTLAEKADLGFADPSGIELQGLDWEDLPLAGFRHPFTRSREWAERIIPARLIGKAYNWLYEAKPRIRKETCEGCGICVLACPTGALRLTKQGLQMDGDLCIECYCCLEHCPSQGLWVPRGLRERLRFQKRS